jgi:acetyl-CoA decarbonylase/synthase, CODH/ACS complex subunit beta
LERHFLTWLVRLLGGKQIEGRLGTGLEQLRSPKFIQADGGLARIVWMPKELKERFKDALEAKGLYDKIASEEDAKNVDELVAFLEKVGHPWLARGSRAPNVDARVVNSE